MTLLAIETSCDDTSAAVLAEDGSILSSVVASQVEIHAKYGGVVPELASRQHLAHISGTVAAAMERAGTADGDLSAVAVTNGPGLLGSLLVGLSYAKALAWGLSIPIANVNHVEAHLRSPWMETPDLPYPSLSLVVSGGHSHLFHCESSSQARLVAATRDDAAGEALDKLGKHMGLPYPAGPVMDRIAPRGNPKAVAFSMPRMSSGSPDYSFSGLKTAALHHMRVNGLALERGGDPDALPQWAYDLIASYQKRVVDHLLQVMRKAALALKPASLTMAGGVACNGLLRRRLAALGDDLGLPAAYPSPCYCTDNAAMVGALALSRRPSPAAGEELDAFPTALWPRLSWSDRETAHALKAH